MATTTNYGWTTPDDTALVKDGAAAIRSLGSAIDSTLKTQIDAQIPDSIIDAKGDVIVGTADNTPSRLGVGTNNQVLTADSSTATGLKWAAPDPLTTKGDLFTYTTTEARLGVGTDGQVLQADSTQSTGLKWATPTTGLNWKSVHTGDGVIMTDIAYNGTNLFVAIGRAGKLLTSPDGQTWTARTSGFGANNILGIAFGAGIWVVVGVNGTIATSTDGTTWTTRTSNMGTNAIYQVVYANSLFVAVGAGGGTTNTGGIIYSSDGITWTRKSQSLTVGTTYWDVGWNGTNWIVVASNSTNNYLYASTPSGTWTAGADGSGANLTGYWWDGTRNIVSNASTFRYSTSATLGTTTSYARTYAWQPLDRTSQNAKFYNGTMYVNGGQYIYQFVPLSNSLTQPVEFYLAPSTYPGNDTVASLSSNGYAYWVGAKGRLVGNGDGSIVSSF